jgi:hypothetical protein
MRLGEIDGSREAAQMFTATQREALRAQLIEVARSHSSVTGAAITGSASVGKEDGWSDIDLAFGVRDSSEVADALDDFTKRMYREHAALHHVDVLSGAWIYRVFLLSSTLQVDLAFAPASDFGARGPTFQLVFGYAAEIEQIPSPDPEELIGWAWLYALHARSSIARKRWWQAEYMISGMRDQVLALACLRHGLPAREGRGMDRLPAEVGAPLEETLVRSLDQHECLRAFRAATAGLIREIQAVNQDLAAKLEPTLQALTELPDVVS